MNDRTIDIKSKKLKSIDARCLLENYS